MLLLVQNLATAAITVDSSSSNTGRNVNNLSWTHNIGAGTDRMLVVGIAVEEDSGSTDDNIALMTFDGIPMTQVGTTQVTTSGFRQRVSIWTLDDGALPPAGSRAISIVFAGTVREVNAGAVSLFGALQAAPEATVVNTITGSNNISTNITTLTNGAWVIDTVGSGDPGSFTAGGSQTERWDRTFNTAAGAMSTQMPPGAGLTSAVQTFSRTANRMAHVVIAVAPTTPPPPPSTSGFCDNFENGLTNWTVSDANLSGISNQTSNSPTNSLFTRGGVVTATSRIVDMTTASGSVTAWIRRGADSFSEDPDTNENLVVEYLNNVGAWATLETFFGNGTNGQIFMRNYALPANALHAGFQLRFRQTGGSGGPPANGGIGWDYWHMDDVCIIPETQIAYYNMDEAQWTGAVNEVIDGSGSNNHGNAVGGVTTASATPAIAGNPGTCGYGDIPSNTSSTSQAVNTNLDVDTDIGNSGSISFWYRSNTAWNDGNLRMLFDASNNLGNNGADKNFYLSKEGNGRLTFLLEDSNDRDLRARTGKNSIAANTWVHIAVTWDLTTDTSQIYINAALAGTQVTNTNGQLGNTNTLYIGDNRTSGVGGSGYTKNSANGFIDEFRTYNFVQNAAAIAADMNATHACGPALDHYAISHPGTGITCLSSPVTITAHDAGDVAVDAGSATITLSTNTGRGTWSRIIAGTGVLTDAVAGDGAATYTFPGGETSVQLAFNYTNPIADPDTVNFDVTDGTVTSPVGGLEDPDLVFNSAGFIFNNDTDGNLLIPTQLSGKNSSAGFNAKTITLQGVRASDNDPAQCLAAFQNQTLNIDLGAECRNPTSCAGSQASINGAAIATNNDNAAALTTAYTTQSLAFNVNGKASTVINYPDAGLMQLHARYNIPLDDGSNTPSGNFMTGSSNDFVVRPFAFIVTVPGNPGAADHTGPLFLSTGQTVGATFQADITALQWQAADDVVIEATGMPGNDGIPDGYGDIDPLNNANLADNLAGGLTTPNFGNETVIAKADINASAVHLHPAIVDGGTAGVLTGAPANMNAANGTVNTGAFLRYSEVGVIEIDAATANYFGTESIQGGSGAVGRFFPDHFAIIGAPTLTHRTDIVACADPFTYMDENFDVLFTLQAQNADNAATTNYETVTGIYDYAYLTIDRDPPGGAGQLNFGAINDPAGAPTALTGRLLQNPGSVAGTFTNGAANITARLQLMRNGVVPDGPFADLRIGINPVDADGVAPATLNLDPAITGANTHVQLVAGNVRFGRLNLLNAFGSELLNLALPLNAEYFDGTGFINNANDNCTAYDGTTATLANFLGNLNAGETTPSGAGTMINGAHDPVNPIILSAPGLTNEGSVKVTLPVNNYLKFDWDNSGTDDDPMATATFGIFSGNTSTIFIQSVP